jgi:hypothetical protein
MHPYGIGSKAIQPPGKLVKQAGQQEALSHGLGLFVLY